MMLRSSLDLSGKYALVTGATRGIGLSVAEAFLDLGCNVYLNGRSKEAADDIANKFSSKKAEVIPLAFDVSDEASVKEAFQVIFKKSKQLDVLVNNAGILDDALIGMVSSEQIKRTYGINVFGTVYCTQYASRLMARKKQGSIINLSSIVGVNGNEGQAVYGGSKAAIIGMTKSLAKELAPSNIRVNAIAPGFIETDMAKSLPDHIFQQRIDSIKMKRIGKPEDIANVAAFLASDLSSYVTGQIIGVDGGMLI